MIGVRIVEDLGRVSFAPVEGDGFEAPTLVEALGLVEWCRAKLRLKALDSYNPSAKPYCACGHHWSEHMGRPNPGECGWETCSCEGYMEVQR